MAKVKYTRYPSKKEIKEADAVQLYRWFHFLAKPKEKDLNRLISLVDRYTLAEELTKEQQKEIGTLCTHQNQFLKVIETSVTCEMVATVCNDCRMILKTELDC